eukprot:3910223-Pleurochrysis_carterae.AAC.1
MLPASGEQLLCSEYSDECRCQGLVYLGKKYMHHKPGHGDITTSISQMGRVKSMPGPITCDVNHFGGDPDKHYYKHCICVGYASPPPPPSPILPPSPLPPPPVPPSPPSP